MLSDYKTLQDLQKDLFSGVFSCYDLVNQYLNACKDQSHLNAFVELYEEQVLKHAREVDQKIRSGNQGKMAGLVLGIKDNLCLTGHTVTAGSQILQGFSSQITATAVQRLLDQDALIIGRLNCDEFAMGASNETSTYGPVKNAIDTERVPGGSSGGSAVAVQAGMCHASLGSDTGGSIRQPASFTGTWGYKPSYGVVSRHGLIAYASSFDQIGPITKSIEDMQAIMEVISGPDSWDATLVQNPVFTNPTNPSQSSQNKFYKIAVIQETIENPGLDPEIKQYTLDLLERLKQHGHQINWIDFPTLKQMVPCYYVLSTAEASSNLARFSGLTFGYRSPNAHSLDTTFTRSRSEGFGTEVKRRIMLGTFVLSSDHYEAYYTKAQKVRKLIQTKTEEVFEQYDFILTPTTATPAFKIGEKSKDPIAMYLADLYTVHANLAGIPAISIPMAQNQKSLPFGIQLMGPYLSDAQLLNAASQLYGLK